MDRPTHAESARTLVAYHDQALLGTLDRNSGAPYGSIAEYAPLPNGDALLLVSDLADHTKNFGEDTRSSLLVAEKLGEPQPLRRPRASLLGEVSTCDSQQRDEYAERYLETHPHAELYIDFDDFAFYRFSPLRIRYIGGFGRMGWIEESEYREAEPDPIWPSADAIRSHMNDDHADALLEMVQTLGDADWAERAVLVDVDRYGCDVAAQTESGEERDDRREEIRFAFDDPLDEPSAARPAFIELVERARNR